MKAEGYPTTPAELDGWYAYPPGKNAADEILPAMGRIKSAKDVFGARQMDAGPWIAAG